MMQLDYDPNEEFQEIEDPKSFCHLVSILIKADNKRLLA